MKKIVRLTFILILTVLFIFPMGCTDNGDDDDPIVDPKPKNQVPVAENFDFGAAFADGQKWEGSLSSNPVFDTVNKFMTFRKKSNASVGFSTIGMSQGVMELKIKLNISSDTMAYIGFSNQAQDISAFCYSASSMMYTLEFSSDSKMYIKKWIDGEEEQLTGEKDTASIPLNMSLGFAHIKIEVIQSNNTIAIKAYSDNNLLLSVQDSDKPILGGGVISLAYTGTGGMAVGAKDSIDGDYQQPEELGLNVYDSPDVDIADSDVNLLSNFAQNWTGRERIFNTAIDANNKVTFQSKSNPEEPQDGVSEYQGLYKDKIFDNVQLEYTFNVISHGEWIMFWFKCVPENDNNISIWGNKQTRQQTNGYSMLITVDGYVQIHKWADGAQIWLNGQGKQLSGDVRSLFNNPQNEIALKMSLEKITLAGEDILEFRVKINNAATVVVQDTDTPFFNAGYIGVQGYAIGNGTSSIIILEARSIQTISL